MNDNTAPLGLRPGVVAMINEAAPKEVRGRLAALIQRMGSPLMKAHEGAPVSVWQVKLLGSIDSPTTGVVDWLIPEPWLQVAADIGADALADLLHQRNEWLIAAHTNALQMAIGAEDASPEGFEAFLSYAIPRLELERALETALTEDVLRDVGLRPASDDSEVLKVALIHGAERLIVRAGPVPLIGWRIWATWATAREMHCPERVVPDQAPRGHIAKALLDMWQQRFPGAPAPGALRLGALYSEHKAFITETMARARRSMETTPDPEVVRPQGIAFRRAIQQLASKQQEPWLDGIADDWIRMEYHDMVLRIGNPPLAECPAGGYWSRAWEVRLLDLARIPPEMLRKRQFRLFVAEEQMVINDDFAIAARAIAG